MSPNLLERIIIEPTSKATSSIIWLHGLGASGEDFVDVLPLLGLPSQHSIRFIFPHATNRAVTINGGLVMPAWYDISHADLSHQQDEKGIRESQLCLETLIDKEITQGIPSDKIIVMGFSQGGAIALFTALRYNQVLGGVGVLSSYLPLHQKLQSEKHNANDQISIFMAHGLMDPIVPYVQGQKTQAVLESLGYEPIAKSYPMAHMVCPQECLDIGKWIQQMLEK